MSKIAMPQVLPEIDIGPIKKADTPAKIKDAAQQFEALLLAQILGSVHQGTGWLGSGEDSAGGAATGFAEQQLAAVMAKQGGFGLAKLIATGLERRQEGKR